VRILHVVPTYYPATRYGGPIVSVHELCAALARRGHEVHVHTTNVDGPLDSDVPIGKPVSLSGVNVWYFRVPALRRLYWSPELGRATRERIDGFSILHTHSIFLWPTWSAARSARARGIPYVVSPRGMMVKELIRRRSSLLKRAWISLIERGNLENADGIHVTSATEGAKVAEFSGMRFPPVHMVPNGIGDSVGHARSGPMPEAMDRLLASGDPIVLCLGRISWKKGIDRLVRAIALLPAARLMIVGSDEDDHTAALLGLATELGIRNRVHVFGPVFGEAKADLYRRATVFALPSHSENFGNVVLEAMAEGCPVVVSPEVGAADIVEELQAGVVVEPQPSALAAAIGALIADTPGRQRLGANAKDAVARKYRWDAIAAQMEGVYESAIARHGGVATMRTAT
jgi:glycosyltransferase involved in cell wall biosynthesis